MKNKFWVLIIIFLIVAVAIGIYFFTKNDNDDNNYTASRSSVNNVNIANNETTSKENILTENNIDNTINDNIPKTEEVISTFSTKIYNSDSNRQNNITITCNTLNDTVVANGATFSFCDTVGKATTARGYLEADIYDKNGKKTKGIGGGNCQVSSTLYNAVLQIPQLAVVERHAHSNKVPYVETGKDAAVAYGSYDLKFRNDYGFDIKITAINTPDSITITLYKIS